MVMKSSTIQYSNSIGQKTGMSKIGNNVMVIPIIMAFMQLYLHEDMTNMSNMSPLNEKGLSGCTICQTKAVQHVLTRT